MANASLQSSLSMRWSASAAHNHFRLSNWSIAGLCSFKVAWACAPHNNSSMRTSQQQWRYLLSNDRASCDALTVPSLVRSQNLHPNIMLDIRERAYQSPTPIQAQGIPIGLSGRDILGCAGDQLGTCGHACCPHECEPAHFRDHL